MIAYAIKFFLWIGFSETRAIAIASSKWLWQLVLSFVAGALILLGCLYLIYLGGEWREASIAKHWAKKNAEIETQTKALASDRANIDTTVRERVRAALDAAKQEPEAPKPVGVAPAVTRLTQCEELPADAAKRLNRIKR